MRQFFCCEPAAHCNRQGINPFFNSREGANAIVTRENSRLIQYIERARNFYGITVIERVPEIIYTKDYIEKNIGINVEYIDNFDEVLKYST